MIAAARFDDALRRLPRLRAMTGGCTGSPGVAPDQQDGHKQAAVLGLKQMALCGASSVRYLSCCMQRCVGGQSFPRLTTCVSTCAAQGRRVLLQRPSIPGRLPGCLGLQLDGRPPEAFGRELSQRFGGGFRQRELESTQLAPVLCRCLVCLACLTSLTAAGFAVRLPPAQS